MSDGDIVKRMGLSLVSLYWPYMVGGLGCLLMQSPIPFIQWTGFFILLPFLVFAIGYILGGKF